MSHVDDGILHAYLDGALDVLSDAGELPDGATASDVLSHLSSCADCRARLDTERAIREGAGIVLGEAAPARVAALPMPVFAASPRRRRMRWVPLSWAATVLLALGGGWWGSELWRAQRMTPAAVEQAESRPQRSEVAPAADAASTAPSAGPIASDRPAGTSPAGAGAVDPHSAASLAGEPLGTESRLGSVSASAQPIGAAGDRPAVSDPEQISARIAQNALAPQGVPLRQTPTTGGSVRPLQSAGVPKSGAMVRPWAVDAAGLKTVAGDFSGLAAFDSLSARERSGALRFAAASALELGRIRGQVFLVSHASEPTIHIAHEPLGAVVRVRQALSSGQEIELISWQPQPPLAPFGEQAIALESVVVTGAAAREARLADTRRRDRAAEVQPDSAAHAVPGALEPARGVRTLEDGRRQLVLRSASGDVWVALQGRLTAGELRALVSGLRQHPLR